MREFNLESLWRGIFDIEPHRAPNVAQKSTPYGFDSSLFCFLSVVRTFSSVAFRVRSTKTTGTTADWTADQTKSANIIYQRNWFHTALLCFSKFVQCVRLHQFFSCPFELWLSRRTLCTVWVYECECAIYNSYTFTYTKRTKTKWPRSRAQQSFDHAVVRVNCLPTSQQNTHDRLSFTCSRVV